MNGFKVAVAELRTGPLWFWCVSFPFHRVFQCPFGKHRQLVIYITNGRTTVDKCVYCDAHREPTAEEIAAHPHANFE